MNKIITTVALVFTAGVITTGILLNPNPEAKAKELDTSTQVSISKVRLAKADNKDYGIGHNQASEIEAKVLHVAGMKESEKNKQESYAIAVVQDEKQAKIDAENKRQQEAEATRQANLKAEQDAKLEAEQQAKDEAEQAEKAKQAESAKVETSTPTSTQETTKSETGLRTLTMDSTAYDVNVASGGHPAFPNGGVAADLSQFPKGTRLKIEYQNGNVEVRTVNDTGTFVASSPNQLDISMPNDQALAYGRQTVTVTVLS